MFRYKHGTCTIHPLKKKQNKLNLVNYLFVCFFGKWSAVVQSAFISEGRFHGELIKTLEFVCISV